MQCMDALGQDLFLFLKCDLASALGVGCRVRCECRRAQLCTKLLLEAMFQ